MVFGIFKKKPKLPPLPTKPELPPPPTEPKISEEPFKAKADLVLAKLESLEIRHQALEEKLKSIETILKELYQMAKS